MAMAFVSIATRTSIRNEDRPVHVVNVAYRISPRNHVGFCQHYLMTLWGRWYDLFRYP